MREYSVVTLLNTEEAGWEEAVRTVERICRAKGFYNKTYYIDLRKYRKGQAPKTDADSTLRRAKWRWFRRVQPELWEKVGRKAPDLLLCLATQFPPQTIALVRGSAARCKAGRLEPADGIFDLVVKSADLSPADAAAAIFEYQAKIR